MVWAMSITPQLLIPNSLYFGSLQRLESSERLFIERWCLCGQKEWRRGWCLRLRQPRPGEEGTLPSPRRCRLCYLGNSTSEWRSYDQSTLWGKVHAQARRLVDHSRGDYADRTDSARVRLR